MPRGRPSPDRFDFAAEVARYFEPVTVLFHQEQFSDPRKIIQTIHDCFYSILANFGTSCSYVSDAGAKQFGSGHTVNALRLFRTHFDSLFVHFWDPISGARRDILAHTSGTSAPDWDLYRAINQFYSNLSYGS